MKPLLEACNMYSIMRARYMSAAEYFEKFMGLIERYADYFFSEPWPEKYDREEATSFSDEDLNFVDEGDVKELYDRLTTVSLRKNMSLEGFEGYHGMERTIDAYYEEFVRPAFVPVVESFRNLMDEKDARKVLDELKTEHHPLLIHCGLEEFLNHEYPKKEVLGLIDELFVLLHKDEKVPSCSYSRCSWFKRQKESESGS